ncbi:MAG: acetyl-CoA C-acyltransferase [Planctomycetota bacterium]
MSSTRPRELALVAGLRTPFCRAGTELRDASAADLATHVFREILDRTGLDPAAVDEVILGCGGADAREANVARVAALRAGVPAHVPALTVQRNCASGMESIHQAWLRLQAGEGEVFLVGGTESMSNYPLVMNERMKGMFEKMARARSAWQRGRAAAGFRPGHLKPRIALQEGLTDPVSGLIMGMTAERVARRFGVSRQAQDQFALRSHQHAAAAAAAGRLSAEIAPLAPPPRFARIVVEDNGIRRGQSIEALANLKPVFDKRNGDVTVGNACQITDGAAALLLVSTARAERLGLRPLALVRGLGQAGLTPAEMGLGPVHATPRALAAAEVAFDALEVLEINEAFAGQVLACMRAFADARYCRDEVGLDQALGEVDPDRVNVNGGAIALGHPIAASGVRIVLTLANELRRQSARLGLATMCIGGGQGQAVVLEAA